MSANAATVVSEALPDGSETGTDAGGSAPVVETNKVKLLLTAAAYEDPNSIPDKDAYADGLIQDQTERPDVAIVDRLDLGIALGALEVIKRNAPT